MNSEFHIILTLEEIRVISFYEFNSIYKTIGDVISEGKRRFEEAIGKEPKYFGCIWNGYIWRKVLNGITELILQPRTKQTMM